MMPAAPNRSIWCVMIGVGGYGLRADQTIYSPPAIFWRMGGQVSAAGHIAPGMTAVCGTAPPTWSGPARWARIPAPRTPLPSAASQRHRSPNRRSARAPSLAASSVRPHRNGEPARTGISSPGPSRLPGQPGSVSTRPGAQPPGPGIRWCQAVRVGEGAGDGGGAAGDLQQAVDVFQVGAHGPLGDAEAAGDLGVGVPGGDQVQQFPLAGGELGAGWRRRSASR